MPPACDRPAAAAHSAKSELRRKMLARRREIGAAARHQASERICQRLLALPQYAAAETIAAFAPMAEEVNLWTLLTHALATGKTVALPRITDFSTRKMTFHQLVSHDALIVSDRGIPEPAATAAMIKNQLFDFLLIPALAVDKLGNRLGYGGGFYDIFLAQQKKCFSCAPVFSCQLVAVVPSEAHDIKINLSITE